MCGPTTYDSDSSPLHYLKYSFTIFVVFRYHISVTSPFDIFTSPLGYIYQCFTMSILVFYDIFTSPALR